MKDHWA